MRWEEKTEEKGLREFLRLDVIRYSILSFEISSTFSGTVPLFTQACARSHRVERDLNRARLYSCQCPEGAEVLQFHVTHAAARSAGLVVAVDAGTALGAAAVVVDENGGRLHFVCWKII